MEFIKNSDANAVTYTIKGRLDTQSSPEFQEVLEEGFKNGEVNLVFDCKDLEYMSSAGLRTVLYAKKNTENCSDGEKNPGSLKLINVCDDVLEVFEMTGFTDMLSINENSEDN